MEHIEAASRLIDEIGVPYQVARSIEGILKYWSDLCEVDRTKQQLSLVDVRAIAQRTHKRSIRRIQILGDFASDTFWNMLLTLFYEEDRSRPVAVTDLCVASGGSTTTALRHISLLEQHGFVCRKPDLKDRRRIFVFLTDKARSKVKEAVLETCSS